MEPNRELKSFAKLLKMERIWLSSQNSMHTISAMFSSCISARYGIERSDGKQSVIVYFLTTVQNNHPSSAVLQQQINQVPCVTAVASLFTHGACDKGWENCWITIRIPHGYYGFFSVQYA